MNKIETTSAKLKLFTAETEYLCMPVSAEEFETYLADGVPMAAMEAFGEFSVYSQPLFDENTTLMLDGQVVEAFRPYIDPLYQTALDAKLAAAEADTGDIELSMVGERWIKRSWYELDIEGAFDINKLSIEISLERGIDVNRPVATYSLYYDGQPFEFLEDYGSNADSVYLRDSEGGLYDFELLEEDYEDE